MLNEVKIIGHLGADPAAKYTAAGKCVVNISVATTEKWKDKDGNKQEETSWHRVVAFDRLAEIMAEYLRKGSLVYIGGKLKYGSYEKDGVKHYTTDIVAKDMTMLGGRSEGGEQRSSGPPQRQASSGDRPARPARPAPAQQQDDFADDDIPF